NGQALTEVNDTNVTMTLGGSPTTALLNATSMTLGWTGQLAVPRGGTGNSTFTAYSLICAGTSATGAFQNVVGTGTLNQALISNGPGALPSWQTIDLVVPAALTKTDDTNVTLTLGGTPATALLQATSLTLGWTGTLSPTRGGTGIGTYVLGDTLYGSGVNTLAKLSGNITSNIQYLAQTGTGAVSAAPVWTTISGGDITGAALTKVDDTNVTLTLGGTPSTALLRAASITAGWTGTLAATRGGTAQSTYATGDTLYASAANTLSKLTGNITTGKQYLSQTGTGAASQPPAWATISGSDITGAALTKADDTNVTLTLGGSPTTALLNASSITAGWTGQLGLTRGGTAASLTASNGGIVYSTASALAILAGTATAGQMLQSGSSTTPAWSTSTYPATNAINTLLYASSANVMAALPTANSSILVTNSSGVPAWGTTLPAFTTSSITFSPTTGGIVGTPTNDNAAAGKVGEFVTSNVAAGSATSISSATATNLTSISLTAGDWDVWGNIRLASTGLNAAADVWISTTSATLPDASLRNGIVVTHTAVALSAPTVRLSLSGTTTVYISAQITITSGTSTQCGTLSARRVR